MRLLPQTFRYALRMLLKSPGATAVAVLALALGIGANTAVYSLADILLYRPLVLPELDRMVTVIASSRNNLKAFGQISPADFLDFRRDTRTIDHLAAVTGISLNLTGSGEPERLSAARVTAGFFAGLAVQPMIGRAFLDREDSPGENPVAILSCGLWTSRFASDPEILTRVIKLEGQSYRVAGVMPRDFDYPPGIDLWIPMAMDARERSLRSAGIFSVVGRLKDGVSASQARSEIEALARRISEQFPEAHQDYTARVELLREYASGNLVADFVRMLLGSVAFVLLIACSNVANLQFSRVSLRSKEIAIRSALGADRFRLLGEFLTESALLGILGGVLGLLLAVWGLDLARSALPPEVYRELPGWTRLGINTHVLLFTAIAAILAGIVAGILPAWFGSRADINDVLKDRGRAASGGMRRHRLRAMLVVSQIVLALVLMVGAGLIAKGSRLVSDPAPNLHPATALVMRITLPDSKYSKPADIAAFEQRLVQSLQAHPRVTAAATISTLPYSGSVVSANFTIEGRDPRETGAQPSAVNERISPDYFRALHLPLRAGRDFSAADGPDAPRVAIISRGLATRYFAGQDPIGKRLKIGLPSENFEWLTIVGVVSDIRQNPFDKNYRPVLYRPFQQSPSRSFDVLIRTTGDAAALESAARAQLATLDRDQPVSRLKTLETLFNDQLSGFRFLAILMGIFGLIALFLACIGVYAVMAYSVHERTHEIGVRMALGAHASAVLSMIVRQGMILAACGLLIGLPAALAVARLLAGILFGVDEYDPATFATGLAVLAGAALLASYLPARRATRVDPMLTLRNE